MNEPGGKLSRPRTMRQIADNLRYGDPEPITSRESLQAFMQAKPGLRRWYLGRVYGDDRDQAFVDLYLALPTRAGLQTLAGLDPQALIQLPEEDPDWWLEEDYDISVHLRLQDFRALLAETSGYSEDQPLVEGMVFLEIWQGDHFIFVPFSYQARQASKQVYRRLLEK